MPYYLLKKYGLFLCLIACSIIFSIADADPIFLGHASSNLTVLDNPLPVSILWLSIYAGILLALLVYNLLLFLTLRTISYLYYAMLTAALLLAYGSFNGLWFAVFWPNSPQWQAISLPISLSLAGIFSISFCRSFLSISTYIPKLDTILYRLGLLFGFVLIASLFIPISYISYALTGLIVILCFVTMLVCIRLNLKSNRGAQLLFLSWLVLLTGITLSISQYLNWITHSWLTHYSLSFSVLLFALLQSLALSHRMIITRTQTQKFHQKILADSKLKITEQVKEQTKELNELNEQLRQQEGLLKKLAFYDGLTGLANRVFIQEQLKQLLAQSRRNKSKVSVLFLDLDDFKPINDEHGHKIGDEVLIIIAKRLQATLRESDVVGRLGCDKFLVLLESSRGDSHDPSEVADKIRTAIAQSISMDWFILNIDTSIGIAHYPNDGKNAASLIAAADSAMQLIKTEKKKAKSQ
jgi:diguanylate cyclase (GGDEF)-like protein